MKQSISAVALVVFEDLYGNKWDLVELTAPSASGTPLAKAGAG